MEHLIIDACYRYNPETKKFYPIPLLEARVAAGFPSSAENFIQKSLDLNDLIIKHPAATFFIRVKGDSMINAGINSGDILVVDRSLEPQHNRIVVARIDDELTVKRLLYEKNSIILAPDNPQYKPLYITPERDFEVWGVVTYVLHNV